MGTDFPLDMSFTIPIMRPPFDEKLMNIRDRHIQRMQARPTCPAMLVMRFSSTYALDSGPRAGVGVVVDIPASEMAMS